MSPWLHTPSGIGGSFGALIVSGLSGAAPERRRGVFSLMFGLQFEHSHLDCFEHSYAGADSMLPAVCSVEAVC